ncbi:MAG: glutamate--tRNA ligase [Gemmatimonadetes bacterium]|nr:glutamate--tRNA ligase [Gemmatimonadota bacterium]
MAERQIRVRFAPSPTGYLHVGGARTALFNWLLARRRGGVFVLRIEDTDRERSSEVMTRAILDGMEWLGLSWDEGPFHQADGVERHRRDALRLLEAGHAYRCFCTPAELESKRARAAGAQEAYRYDRNCLLRVSPEEAERRAAAGQPFALRCHVPEGVSAWEDVVHGRIEFANAEIEDFIVLRSDGTPVYNLAVVSDDLDMRITHVLRGDDHISNTPKQILLYRALGQEPPVFGHVPMILGPDGKRLSKRHGATAIGEYREQGLLPWALVNFLALLGWSPGTDEEIFDVPELIARFSLEGINKKSAIFDSQKLIWLNGQHLTRASAERLEPLVTERLVAAGIANADALRTRRAWVHGLIDLLKVRARNLDDIVRQARPYLAEAIDYEQEAVQKHWKHPAQVRQRLAALRQRYAGLERWDEQTLEAELRAVADELGTAAGKLIHPLRVSLTGMAVSPGIFEVLVTMGRELALRRLDAALAALERREREAPSSPDTVVPGAPPAA